MKAIRRLAQKIKPKGFLSAIIALVLIVTSDLNLATIAKADNPPRKILSGWLPYYSMSRNIQTINENSDLIREFSPFWYRLDAGIKITDMYTPGNPSTPIEQVLNNLRAQKYVLIPTIADNINNAALSALLANPTDRATLITNIRALIAKYNYDGIDIDFESFICQGCRSTWPNTQPNWIKFIQELGAALKSDGKLLSVTSPLDFAPETKRAGNTIYSWGQIANSIDRLRIMAYDYTLLDANGNYLPGPIGPIQWTEDAVKWAIANVPASKVFLGIPGYGRQWITKVDGICPKDFVNDIKFGTRSSIIMTDAFDLAKSYAITPTYDETYQEATFSYQKSYTGISVSGLATTCTASRTVWFPTERSYSVRAALVGKYRLGGIAVWTFGMETDQAAAAIREVAKQIAPDVVKAIATSDLAATDFGNPVNLTGSFKLPDTRPLPGLPVRLEIKNQNETNWRSFNVGTTNADGAINVSLIVGQSAQVRLISEGTWERLEGKTTELNVAVVPAISVNLPASIKTKTNYLVSGQVQPKIAGWNIALERNGKLMPVGTTGTTGTTDTSGRFSLTLNENETGVINYRIVVIDAQSKVLAATEVLSVLVR